MNFDAPKSVVAQCKRERSNTPLQALNLLNDPVFLESAVALAYRAVNEASDTSSRIHSMFGHTLARPATKAELERFGNGLTQLRAVYEKDAESAAQLAPAELPGISRSELAAWVNLGSVLLNLDEFITKE